MAKGWPRTGVRGVLRHLAKRDLGQCLGDNLLLIAVDGRGWSRIGSDGSPWRLDCLAAVRYAAKAQERDTQPVGG